MLLQQHRLFSTPLHKTKFKTSANTIYAETTAGPLFRTSLYRLMKKSYGMSAFPVKPLRYTRAVLGYLWKGATAEAKRRKTHAAVPPGDETHSPQCRPLSKALRRKIPTLQDVQPDNLSGSLQDGFMSTHMLSVWIMPLKPNASARWSYLAVTNTPAQQRKEKVQ